MWPCWTAALRCLIYGIGGGFHFAMLCEVVEGYFMQARMQALYAIVLSPLLSMQPLVQKLFCISAL